MNFVDIFTFGPILILATILFWLYNREIRKTLEQTRVSEQMLAKDRDAMKIEIGERTKELKENRIARMNELAKAAEFGRLSQGLFHDLMTPLTSMVLHAEKIQDSKIKEASDRMTAYISDIRSTLSREESDRECLLREELENIVHLLEYRIRTNGIDISINEEGHCTWHGNPVKLRQIFSNLLSNAIDSFDGIKTEKKKIGISLEKNSIKVEDNGCGIKEEDIEKIFTPFFTTKTLDRGTGIGLTTVKSIVENDLKGTIEARNNPAGGSVFTVAFPGKDPASSLRLPQTPPRLL